MGRTSTRMPPVVLSRVYSKQLEQFLLVSLLKKVKKINSCTENHRTKKYWKIARKRLPIYTSEKENSASVKFCLIFNSIPKYNQLYSDRLCELFDSAFLLLTTLTK